MLLRIIFWIFGILFSIVSVLGIYFLAFYFGFFGVLEKAEPNVNATYPKDLLTKKYKPRIVKPKKGKGSFKRNKK